MDREVAGGSVGGMICTILYILRTLFCVCLSVQALPSLCMSPVPLQDLCTRTILRVIPCTVALWHVCAHIMEGWCISVQWFIITALMLFSLIPRPLRSVGLRLGYTAKLACCTILPSLPVLWCRHNRCWSVCSGVSSLSGHSAIQSCCWHSRCTHLL